MHSVDARNGDIFTCFPIFSQNFHVGNWNIPEI